MKIETPKMEMPSKEDWKKLKKEHDRLMKRFWSEWEEYEERCKKIDWGRSR